MGKVLKADCSVSDAYVTKTGLGVAPTWTVQFDAYIPSSTFTAMATDTYGADLVQVDGTGSSDGTWVTAQHTDGTVDTFGAGHGINWGTDWWTGNPVASFTPDVWLRSVVAVCDGTNTTWTYAGVTLFSYASIGGPPGTLSGIKIGGIFPPVTVAGEVYYIDNVVVKNNGGAVVFSDDFESGGLSAWTSTTGDVSVVDDPVTPPVTGRVLIAFDDGPLVASPTWTTIDQAGDFPDQFVSGYDTSSGRQTLLDRTDTGTATVYINDHVDGLFDPRNAGSPYFGKLDGKQIMLQLYNPVTAIWEPQFRGWIDEASYDINGSAVNADGDPINASIQLNCVDVFEYLGGYGLTPGLDGVTPPAGMEDGVYYAETAGSVDDRIIEILTDVGINPTRYIVASGNVRVIAVKYDPDEAAITALRDACDAEIPFIANMYVNRHGQFVFRGRYSRFYPDLVAAEPLSEWDFTRWAVGDGKAIQADATRAQMRVLSYTRGRFDILNVAVCYPQGIAAADMPGQVFADTTSITAYGKHVAPPMSDLLTLEGTVSGFDKNQETAAFAELLVKNKKNPHIAVSSLQVKTVHPSDARATHTWAFLTKSDISHIVNVAVGYPGGTGLTGDSPADDHFIEGRRLIVRPLQPGFDYVELDIETTPVEWSSDFHDVFPNPFE